LKSILKPGGQIFIVEPNFHVSRKEFDYMINKVKNMGFRIEDRPKVFFSRTIILKNMA